MTVAKGIARKSDIERIAEKLKQLSQAILLGRHATYHGDFEPLRDALHDLGVYLLWGLCVASISFCGELSERDCRSASHRAVPSSRCVVRPLFLLLGVTNATCRHRRKNSQLA